MLRSISTPIRYIPGKTFVFAMKRTLPVTRAEECAVPSVSRYPLCYEIAITQLLQCPVWHSHLMYILILCTYFPPKRPVYVPVVWHGPSTPGPNGNETLPIAHVLGNTYTVIICLCSVICLCPGYRHILISNMRTKRHDGK